MSNFEEIREFNAKKWSQRETWINTPGEFYKDSKEPLFVEIGYVGAEQSMENQGPILKKNTSVTRESIRKTLSKEAEIIATI